MLKFLWNETNFNHVWDKQNIVRSGSEPSTVTVLAGRSAYICRAFTVTLHYSSTQSPGISGILNKYGGFNWVQLGFGGFSRTPFFYSKFHFHGNFGINLINLGYRIYHNNSHPYSLPYTSLQQKR